MIILRNTQLPDNIGMSARSMVNYGFKDLRIVKPKVKWPNKKADSASAGAFDIINKNTKIYSNIEDSFKGIDIIFATSVRNRDLENIVLSPREAVKIAKYKYKNNKIGFLFGPEKVERFTKEKPSEEDMKKMAPCMEPGKTKPKPKNGKGPTVYSPKQMKCLNDVFGPKKAESIRLGGMANISSEVIKKMEPCMQQ